MLGRSITFHLVDLVSLGQEFSEITLIRRMSNLGIEKKDKRLQQMFNRDRRISEGERER
jgi:hypothetical protein